MTTEALSTDPTLRERVAAIPGEALLRGALVADAAITGTNGVAYLAGGTLLDGPLGLEASLLQPAGAFLIVFAAGLLWLASRPAIPAAGVALVVTGNFAWALTSVAILVAGTIDPTTGGAVWVALQALVVGAFASVQLHAQRRAR